MSQAASKTNLLGVRFGRLLVVGHLASQRQQRRWLCSCDCGKRVVATTSQLRRKDGKKSCGCLHREIVRRLATKHNQCGTRLYRCWAGVKRRCKNRNDAAWARYGGRGIRVCEEWENYEPFMSWAIKNGYRDDKEIDRIDNDGNYEPSNCRWATRSEQVLNRSDNRRIEYRGEKRTMKEWALLVGLNYDALRGRIDRGWSIRRALTTPADLRFQKRAKR